MPWFTALVAAAGALALFTWPATSFLLGLAAAAWMAVRVMKASAKKRRRKRRKAARKAARKARETTPEA